MPTFMQSIKSKLPAMPSIAGSKPSTPATEEVPVVTPETIADTEQTPAPAPAPAATDSLHLPGELALASSSDIALPAAETVSTPAPAVVEPATVAAPEPVVEAPKPIEETVLPAVAPAVTPVVTEPEATPLPEVETVVVGSITGGEPGLSEPLPGLATNAEAITAAEELPSVPAAEPTTESAAAVEPTIVDPTPQVVEPIPTPATDVGAAPVATAASPQPSPAQLSFPSTTVPGTETKENEGPNPGKGRSIRPSIRRLGRSKSSRKSTDVPRKSIDVASGGQPGQIAEEETEDKKKEKVPLGDRLKGVYEEVKGRVKKNPEGVAYGKALRTGDLNV